MKTMLNYIIVICLISTTLILSQPIKIQTSDIDLAEKNLSMISVQIQNLISSKNNADLALNRADIAQLGNNNEAFIEQVKNNEFNGNTGTITQYSDNNLASLNQSGSGNLNLINQNGPGNKTIVNVEGSYNNSVLIQEGNNNFLAQRLDSDRTKYYFAQQGSNNVIIQQENETVSKPCMIFQKGNGMRLMISSGVIK